jgi:hypothetical protein
MPTQAPPDVPPNVPPQVADYLRRLSTWAFQEIDKKIPKNEATAHVLLIPSDVKIPAKVFKITVDSAGAVHTAQAPLAGGPP